MPPDTAARWAWMREQTPAARRTAYLNCGWSGPLSVPVADAMRAYLDLDLAEGPTTRTTLTERLAVGDRFRAETARALGCEPSEVTITGNTTEGINIVINGLPWEAGDRIVITSVEHGSGFVPAYMLGRRRGVDVAIVELDPTLTAEETATRFARAIDDRTRLVLLSEISYSTGQLLPLGAIVAAAHRRGAQVLVDGAQTLGHVPIDVRQSGVDYYAVPSHKWLLGPDGLGALYVRADRIAALEPVKVAGRAAASYDQAGGFVPEREAITKFELTTVSGVLLAGAAAACTQYLDSGPEAVWDRVRELNRLAERRFDRIAGVRVASTRLEEARTGLFAFEVAGEQAARVSAFLQLEAGVVCRYVGEHNTVRLSLHVYNDESDIERAAEGVERALRDGIPAQLDPVTPWEARAATET